MHRVRAVLVGLPEERRPGGADKAYEKSRGKGVKDRATPDNAKFCDITGNPVQFLILKTPYFTIMDWKK